MYTGMVLSFGVYDFAQLRISDVVVEDHLRKLL